MNQSSPETGASIAKSAVPLLQVIMLICVLGSAVRIDVGGFTLGLHLVLLIATWATTSARTAGGTGGRVATAVVLWSGALVVHFAASLVLSPCADLLPKSALSLALMLLLAMAISQLAARTPVKPLGGTLKFVVFVVVAGVVVDHVVAVSLSGGDGVRTGGIYAEPSHLALTVAPILVGLMCTRNSTSRLWGWGSFLALTLLSASATLFVVVTLCLVMALLARARRSLSPWLLARITAFIVVAAGLLAVSPYATQFADRITGLVTADETANLSSLVYLNGWETARANLEQTRGFGLGFNRMGCDPRPETAIGALLETLQLGDQNYNDGSFTLAKLLSELGILGLLFWCSALLLLLRWCFVPSAKRALAHLPPDAAAMLIAAVTVFTLGGLIRSINYLAGPTLFGLFAISLLMVCERRGRRNASKTRPAARTTKPPPASETTLPDGIADV